MHHSKGKGNTCMQGNVLTQRYACKINQARFGKENSVSIYKEMETYVNGREHAGCHLFGSPNNINDRDLFLFLPPPRKKEVSQCVESWRLVRDFLSLKDRLGSTSNII